MWMATLDQAHRQLQTWLWIWQEPGELSVPGDVWQANHAHGTPGRGRHTAWASSLRFPLGTVPVSHFQVRLRVWDCSRSLLTTDLAGGTACRPSTKGQRQHPETNFFCTGDCRSDGPNSHCMGHRDHLCNEKEIPELPSVIDLPQPATEPPHFAPQLDPYPSLHRPQKL